MNQETPHENSNGNGNGNGRHKAITIAPARLPYHPALEERFGVGQAEWRALVDAIFPLAKESESIILALSYCRARKLDPFKRVVHIVPMYNAALGRMVETVWPGIGELRTTAFRTRQYAGRDNAEFGPTVTRQIGTATIEFPEWCQITAYRVLDGQKYPFPGPRVYWMECYATAKKDDPTPNSMWRKRPFGQLDKCAEAAALRAAFPEEIGNDLTADEMEGKTIGVETTRIAAPPRSLDAKLDAIANGDGHTITETVTHDPPLKPATTTVYDPETGEIINVMTDAAAMEAVEHAYADAAAKSQTVDDAARQLAAKLAAKFAESTSSSATSGVVDQQLQKLLDAGRAAAVNSPAKYKKWENNLSAPDFERVQPHLDALRKAAAAGDTGGV